MLRPVWIQSEPRLTASLSPPLLELNRKFRDFGDKNDWNRTEMTCEPQISRQVWVWYCLCRQTLRTLLSALRLEAERPWSSWLETSGRSPPACTTAWRRPSTLSPSPPSPWTWGRSPCSRWTSWAEAVALWRRPTTTWVRAEHTGVKSHMFKGNYSVYLQLLSICKYCVIRLITNKKEMNI